jgi:hypothetical protein
VGEIVDFPLCTVQYITFPLSKDCGIDEKEVANSRKDRYFHSLASNGLWTENVLHISWMRSSRVVRASGYQCQSRNSPGFDPSILRHS